MVKPVNYWTFNKGSLEDSIDNKNPLKATGDARYTSSMVGKAIEMAGIVSMSSSKSLITAESGMGNSLSISFLYQLEMSAQNTSLVNLITNNSFQIVLLPQGIRWNTFHQDKTKHIWDIPLKGNERQNLTYYLDHRFHQWVFTFDSKKGEKQFWVDGVLVAEEKMAKELKSALVTEGLTQFQGNVLERRNNGRWDEIAFYNVVLSPNMIRKQWIEAQAGKSFSYVDGGNFVESHPSIQPSAVMRAYDVKEFAKGYPNVSESAITQLQSYPTPRFKPFHQVHRNLNWQGIMYYDKKDHTGELLELYVEMAKNWNYYYLVAADAAFPPLKGQVELANENPWFPLQMNTYWAFTNTQHFNPSWKKSSYMLSPNLPKANYLTDKAGNYLTGKPVWSPASGLDSVRKDGILMRMSYEKYVAPILKRPIDIIGENGEVFGAIYKDDILIQDPKVVKDKQTHFPGWDWLTYQSYRRYQVDSTYRAELMKPELLRHAEFLYYIIQGEHVGSTYKYEQIRKVHVPIRNTRYSTPSFYPVPQGSWAATLGWRKGWYHTMSSRAIELSFGDKWFSPFITPGISGNEEELMRPARWLGLMKGLAVTGAEFYHTYFYTGTIVSHPKNFIWNVVIPAYVQGITSRYMDVFLHGHVLEGDMKNPEDGNKTPSYRFWTGNPNYLVVARKHDAKERYVIMGTIQPIQLSPDAMPREDMTTIELGGEKLRFEIRQQGSTYIYDKSGGKVVFYQLDKWHQYEHPDWWSKNFAMEAEVMDSVAGGNVQIVTEKPAGLAAGDFSSFTSFIQAGAGTKVGYFFQPRNIAEQRQFLLKVRARVKGNGSAKLGYAFDANSLDYKQPGVYTGKRMGSGEISMFGGEWKWYEGGMFTGFEGERGQTLWLMFNSAGIEVDEVVMEAK